MSASSYALQARFEADPEKATEVVAFLDGALAADLIDEADDWFVEGPAIEGLAAKHS